VNEVKETIMSDPNEYFRSETPEQRRAFVKWLRQAQEDYLWCLNQHEVLERYPGQVVVLHNRRIIGHGIGTPEARQDAQDKAKARGETLPPKDQLVLVPIPEHPWIDEAVLSRLANGVVSTSSQQGGDK
jgi:hypothetical protein